ncbi:hypothetical protein APSETT444_004553 [Aspergillus pseudonomiae]
MHACIGGRPVLFADRDIGIKKPGFKPSHARTAFDAWFAISDLLAHVISFYRPTSDHTVGWEAGFPTFEEIMGDDVREDLDFTTLGFLELFYHAVAILSCRYKLTGRPDGSKSSYIRQGLSAIRIHSIVATECSQDLPAIPIVPYALTLSMGVSYQQFRSSKLITHSDRAKASLEACCTLLEALGISWCSAEAMARLGRKALHQIDGLNLGSHKPSQASTQPPAPGNTLINSTNAQSAEPVLHLPSYQSDDYPFNDLSAAKQASSTQGSLDPPENNMQVCETDGFADIDVLFGDFLDLSLPTNFWDPVDVRTRIQYLNLPLQNLEAFDGMLQDRNFRLTMIDYNQKIEHAIERFTTAIEDALKDMQKGKEAIGVLWRYLKQSAEEHGPLPSNLFATHKAMLANTEGWNVAFSKLRRKGFALQSALSQLCLAITELQRRVGVASRKEASSHARAENSKELE